MQQNYTAVSEFSKFIESIFYKVRTVKRGTDNQLLHPDLSAKVGANGNTCQDGH